MNEEIQKLNEWLESKAVESENEQYWIDYEKENPGFKNCWPPYYRRLKDLDVKDSFTISSIHWKGDVLTEYLHRHESEYIKQPATGSCSYFKR